MASINAIEEYKVRGRPRRLVTIGTGGPLMWNSPPRMSECRGGERSRVMARRAGTRWREAIASMVWHRPAKGRGAIPIRSVAAVAIDWRRCGREMAKVASRSDVRPGQRKSGGVVIERRTQPGSRGVAGIARRRVSGSDMVRHRPAQSCGALVVGSVATVTIGRQRPAVVAIHVAQRAGRGGVRPGQWESRRGVIESRSCPIRSRVANRAVRWESGRNVIWNRTAKCRCAIPLRCVATVTSRGGKRKIITYMARSAGRRG
jgi:hypothetical protein